MISGGLPELVYGAVYFRKSNPPREDWSRDYGVAAEDGHNVFRHWFLWSAVEVAPGEFDWGDYDVQLDLAAEHGLKTIVAEMVTAAPEWAFRRLGHARFVRSDGRRVGSSMSASCVTGGFPGLCLDNADVRELAGRFLRELVSRYRGHPGLGVMTFGMSVGIWRMRVFVMRRRSVFGSGCGISMVTSGRWGGCGGGIVSPIGRM